jgi:hypothetical protein
MPKLPQAATQVQRLKTSSAEFLRDNNTSSIANGVRASPGELGKVDLTW